MTDRHEDGRTARDTDMEETVADAVRDDLGSQARLVEMAEDRVRTLAREQIKAWRQNQPSLLRPKSWGRGALSGAAAAAALLSLGAVQQYFAGDAARLTTLIHHLLRTDAQVTASLEDMADAPGSVDNSLRSLVRETVAPTQRLAFQGYAGLNEFHSVSLTSPACRRWVGLTAPVLDSMASTSEFAKLPPAQVVEAPGTSTGVDTLCRTEILLPQPNVEIPFQARPYLTKSGHPPQNVVLMAHITRTGRDDKPKTEDPADATNSPMGVCVLYHTADTNLRRLGKIEDGVRLTEWTGHGQGLWSVNVTDVLKKILPKWRADYDHIQEELHAISFHSIATKNETSPEDDAGPPPSCAGVDSIEDEAISVRAIVMVKPPNPEGLHARRG